MDTEAKFQVRAHETYDHFKNMQWDSCEEALARVRDAHQWALVAAALLEENIKQLSHFVTMGGQAVTDISALIDAWVATGGPSQLATKSRSPQQCPGMGTL